jgi:hypothetical protein
MSNNQELCLLDNVERQKDNVSKLQLFLYIQNKIGDKMQPQEKRKG